MGIRLDDLGGADPYELLGVEPSAARETIEAAHRRLMRQAHPDLVAGDGSQATLLNLARDVLLDEQSRRAYDLAMQRRVEAVVPWPAPPPRGPSPPQATPDHRLEPGWPEPQADEVLPEDLDVLMSVSAPVGSPRPWRTGPALGVFALLLTVACFPLGLALGAVALVRGQHPSRADRVCAWLAVALGIVVLWVGAYLLADSLGPATQESS
jgi:hypothetical protein